jgi:hypothetical protein
VESGEHPKFPEFHSVLDRAQASLDRASKQLGRPGLTVLTEPLARCPKYQATLAGRFADRSFIALIAYDERAVYVIPDFVSGMPSEVLDAMMAHEAGHEADWVSRALSRVLRTVLTEGLHAAWRWATRHARERFADRVGANLVGRRAMLQLLAYVPPGTDIEEWDGPYRRARLSALHTLPDRPTLPPTLRLQGACSGSTAYRSLSGLMKSAARRKIAPNGPSAR